jgi:hypothetical protein
VTPRIPGALKTSRHVLDFCRCLFIETSELVPSVDRFRVNYARHMARQEEVGQFEVGAKKSFPVDVGSEGPRTVLRRV